MKSQKRKHVTLSIKDKQTIIERIIKGESQTKLAREYGVGRATVNGIYQNREKIQNYVVTSHRVRKTMKESKYPEIEDDLYKWYLKQKMHGPVSGPSLATQAKILHRQITGKDDFNASKGWVERFKTRYGIRTENNNKDIPLKHCCIEDIKKIFLEIVANMNLNPSQIYTADESKLSYSFVPNKIYDDSGETSSLKERLRQEIVTILSCFNASGRHKLKLNVIGKSGRHSSLLSNIDSINYSEERGALMTKDLFKKWFDEIFVTEVKEWLLKQGLPQKALLLLVDNSNHPSKNNLVSVDNSIVTIYLPRNCEDSPHRFIDKLIKQDYKNNILRSYLPKDQPIDASFENIKLKDMLIQLKQSWDHVSADALISSWGKFWPQIHTLMKDQPIKCEDNQDKFSEILNNRINEVPSSLHNEILMWYYEDDDEKMSEEDTIKDNTMSDSEADVYQSPSVSARDAVNSFETCLKWAQEHNASSQEIELLRNMRDKASLCLSRQSNKGQVEEYLEVVMAE